MWRLSDREMSEQVLDSMELERERGITIKAQSVCLEYKSRNGDRYSLNFIDTPGQWISLMKFPVIECVRRCFARG
ncbi:MAG: hypothetical protein CM1200mP39_29500 [Dehalococcoidia bacterium]|nr:MAG: hypothetical protein CM1200mP39_29500 [Dehalococcoidia bacterium]